MFIKTTALLSTLLFAGLAQAGSAALWHKMIDVRRDTNGQITELVFKHNKVMALETDSSILLNSYRDQLTGINSSALPQESELQSQGWTKEEVKDFKDASKKVFGKKEILAVANNRGVDDIMKFFEKALNGIYSLHVIAAPGNPGFFFERRLIDKAMDQALGMAGNIADEIPGLNIVQYLLDTTLGLMVEKRNYGQQMALYFLENNTPDELGLTATEVAYIKSSLYETAIKWYDFKAMEKAKKNWALYGDDAFMDDKEYADKRVKKYSGDFDVWGARHAYAFNQVSHKGLKYEMNLMNKKSKLQGELSVAYNYASPTKIMQFRQQMQLVHFATQFLPLPGFIKGQLSSLIASYYAKHKQTEGGLYAHFVANNQITESRILLAQTNNPFLIREW